MPPAPRQCFWGGGGSRGRPSGPAVEPDKKVGFELIESRDAATAPNPGGEAWYKILTPSYFSLFRIQFTPIGTFLMNRVLNAMEMVGIAPKGSGKVREMLRQGQLGLVTGGQCGTFTPMYLVIAQKPLE